jgi:broad specificity phosphatase PhoE
MRSEVWTTSPTCRLVWVRHASPEGEGLFLGQSDVPLSTKGRRQLPRLAQKISQYPAQAVYSSDLQRARATAAAISRRLRVEVKILSGLREIHFGRWQGLSWAEIGKRFPRVARRWQKGFPWQRIPGGEDFAEFKRRVRRTLIKIVGAHPGGCAIVVAHAGVLRVVIASALGIRDRYLFRIAPDYGRVNIIDYFPGGAIVRCVNG